MVQKESILAIADNSGVIKARCISTPVGSLGKPGDSVLLSVRSTTPFSKFKKGELVSAIIVRVKKPIRYCDGSSVSFSSNAAVLVKAQGFPIGKRLTGPVSSTLRSRSLLRILFLSKVVL